MENQNKTKPWLLGVAIIFFSLLIMVGLFFGFEKIYKNKVYPNTYLGEINLSGKNSEEVNKTVNDKINQINQNGIVLKHESRQILIFPIITSIESDSAYEIIHFDIEKTVNQAIWPEKNKNILSNIKNKIFSLIWRRDIQLSTTVNEKEIIKIIEENFSEYHMPAENATLSYKTGTASTTSFYISEEKLGKIIDSEKAIKELKHNLEKTKNDPIYLTTRTDYPTIYKKDCLNIDKKTQDVIALAPITLKYNGKEWKIEQHQLADWVDLKINQNTEDSNDKIIIGLNSDKAKKFLEESIAVTINKEATNAKFEIKDGKVTQFQNNQEGLELNIDANLKNIEEEFLINKNNQINLIVDVTKGSGSIGEINNLGIKEIIGTGHSNFAGSPSNRRHNIRIGANTLNGLIIKPGEEFSLLKALGKIDGSTGYLQELVIKDNKTIPEYGGGLCQIGTTAFRTTLESGLPVTLRRNHSYRVVYYEPAGTDATIYDPWPDYRFINDTGNHVLIQTRIEGDNLYFDFWGTKDGRTVEKTDPIIYNITKPGPTKIIETLDLKPGEKKCTERAHNGADAYFDYKVIYNNGETKEERFTSHYVPWQEVCLLGVEKLTTENTETGSTSSEGGISNTSTSTPQ